MEELDRLLAKGLGAGFAGETTPKTIQRGSFEGKQSTYPSPEKPFYLDEWFAHQNGGGQELVQDDEGKRATRVYAGGNLPPEELAELGTTEDEVSVYLVRKINGLGEKTRLRENCHPEPDGNWQYSYEILKPNVDGVALTIGLEKIAFKQTTVFAHGFLLSPVE